jgi:hypothetical protein
MLHELKSPLYFKLLRGELSYMIEIVKIIKKLDVAAAVVAPLEWRLITPFFSGNVLPLSGKRRCLSKRRSRSRGREGGGGGGGGKEAGGGGAGGGREGAGEKEGGVLKGGGGEQLFI